MTKLCDNFLQPFSILIPRAKLKEAGKRSELQRCSVYFLIGASDEDGKPLVYIGEAVDGYSRLKQHNKQKDFWTTAVAVVSITRRLTKTHIQYLEWLGYLEAEKTGRYVLENSKGPSKPFVSEPMEAELRDYFEEIKLLISTLGYPIFDQIAKPKKEANHLLCW